MDPLTWRQLVPQVETMPLVNPRKRLRQLIVLFVLAWLAIIARAIQLEWRHGEAFRAEALRPLRREIPLPAVRGRILARDGTVLAADERLLALAVHYRYLQHTPDESWLRNQARQRLPKSDRRKRERVEAETAALAAELTRLNRLLAENCGLTWQEWQSRAGRIENRIETMAAHVNERRWERFEGNLLAPSPVSPTDRPPWWNVAANLPDALRALGTPEEPAWEAVILKEQVDYHIMVENLPPTVAEEIRTHADRYPGVRVIDVPRRTYSGKTFAANVLGHLGRSDQLDSSPHAADVVATVGLLGLERVLELQLGGHPGKALEHTDRRGQLISTMPIESATDGNDVQLTLDSDCQRTAEALLDRTLVRNHKARGGAIVVLDVTNGEVLALASAPRFDPNAFALANADAIHRALTDSNRPMFDRAARMALPPGALAKPFVAVAMLESGRVPEHAAFCCEGYFRDPEGLCCAIYRQQGVGHGDVTLATALAKNCNVFFAHYAGVLGADSLVARMTGFGFGQPTRIELADEASGSLPHPIEGANGVAGDYRTGEAQLVALGQGNFTVTPLQMARAMAVIANGGKVLTPKLVRDSSDEGSEPPEWISTNVGALAAVREALRRAVTDEEGAAHDALVIDGIAIAGLAATGEVSGAAVDHAWCAGYFPAGAPRFAFAVAIEHGGDGAKVAAPIAKRLIQRLGQLRWFDPPLVQSTDRRTSATER